MSKADREYLTLGYRVGWRIRSLALNVFGPAQMGRDDPQLRLQRERSARAASVRRAREAHTGA